jgi:membrane protease YdiL (CAAX protease family)
MTAAAPADVARRNLYLGCAAAGISPYLINGYVNSKIAAWPALYWSFEVLCWIVIPAAVFAVLVRRDGLRAADLGLHGRIFRRHSVGLVVVACMILCPIDAVGYAGVYGYFRTILPDEGLFKYHSMVPEGGAARLLTTLYFALSAGIVEELYFRGLLFKAASFFPGSSALYLLLSPLLFAAIHWESGPANAAAAYTFGLFSAAVFLMIRNLWPLIAGHIYTDYAWFG